MRSTTQILAAITIILAFSVPFERAYAASEAHAEANVNAAKSTHLPPSAGVPHLAKAMLDAAARTEDPAQIAAVAYAAGEVFVDDVAAIDRYGDYLRTALGGADRVNVETIIAAAAPKPEKIAPVVAVRTADQGVEPAAAPSFLNLGDWTGKANASGLISAGNSRNAAAGLLVEASRPAGDFTHNLRGYFDYGRSQEKKTQQRWGGSYKLDYQITDRSFAYTRVSYDEDEFSGFDYRLFAGAGYGHWLIKNEKLAFRLQGGPGYQYAPIDDTREVDSFFAFYSASEFDWVIFKGLKFEQDMNVTWTEPTTTLISRTGISAAFTDTLSTGFSYMYRYETSPPLGRLKRDTTFRANLTYGF